MLQNILLLRRSRSSRWVSVNCTLHWTAAFLFVRSHGAISLAITPKMSKIAVGQVCATTSKWQSLLNAARCAGWASTDCSMLFLPECFGFLGSNSQQTLQAAEPKTTVDKRNPSHVTEALVRMVRDCAAAATDHSPIEDTINSAIDLSDEEDLGLSLLDGLRTIAAASSLWISAGSMHVAVEDEPRVYNTHIIVDPTGLIRAEYRKVHLFDVCIPGKVDLSESKTTKAGTELVVCPDTPIGNTF